MEKKLRHLMSFGAIVGFLAISIASFGPDTSTYLEVLKEGCVGAPLVIVSPRVEVVVLDQDDRPFIGQPVSVFTNYQKITDHINCITTSTFENYTGFTDANGMLVILLSDMQQNSSGDLIRVEVRITESVDYTGVRVAKLIGYGFESVDFLITLNEKSIL